MGNAMRVTLVMTVVNHEMKNHENKKETVTRENTVLPIVLQQ